MALGFGKFNKSNLNILYDLTVNLLDNKNLRLNIIKSQLKEIDGESHMRLRNAIVAEKFKI